MSLTFSELVEEIRSRPIEEKIELKEVFEHDLIESQREEIYQNGVQALRDIEAGTLTFTSDIHEHMRRLEEE